MVAAEVVSESPVFGVRSLLLPMSAWNPLESISSTTGPEESRAMLCTICGGLWLNSKRCPLPDDEPN